MTAHVIDHIWADGMLNLHRAIKRNEPYIVRIQSQQLRRRLESYLRLSPDDIVVKLCLEALR